jgi:phosphinothricin acetyltransferase
MVTIRKATLKDIVAITEIYNDAVLKTVTTFDTETKTYEEQKIWFDNHGINNPIIVAEHDRIIVGWAALSRYSTRCAYSDTAEISLYVREQDQGKGIGKKLMQSIVNEGENTSLHTIISRITDGNEKSIYLHKSVGFEHIGIMKEVGNKFGRRLDVCLMQKVYKNTNY